MRPSPEDPSVIEYQPERPSKTKLKQQAHLLQTLGEELVELPAKRLAETPMPEILRDAIEQYHRTRSFEGKRRQLQYIGKLMRLLDPIVLEDLRAALSEQHSGSARDNLALHQAELWRDRLIGQEDALEAWLLQHPGTDTQQLRALIRQARKDALPEKPGAAPRHGRAYRDIFQILREQLAPSDEVAHSTASTQPA